MIGWNEIPDNGRFAIVIYTFKSEDDAKLNVNVGESLHLLQEESDWYYGYNIRQTCSKGIIPKNYVKVLGCKIDQTDPTTNFQFVDQLPIVQEITQVLREWSTLWKNLYITNRAHFETIKSSIYELINYRSQITSGTLPVDELKKVTREVCEKIATVNRTLQLDLVVRDKDGNIINPDETSTIQLYRYHKNAADSISEPKTEPKEHTVSVIQQYSHIFIVSVKNFTCKVSEDSELLMFLYDMKENKAITENYIVHWSKEGLMKEIDRMNNLRVMFTDLGKKDLEREKIYLVCYAVRVGVLENKDTVDHSRRSSTASLLKKEKLEGMRRPLGVAAKDVTIFLNGKFDADLEQEFSVPFYNCDKDNLEQTLRKITNKEDGKSDNKNQSLFISMKLLHGDLKQVREENPHLVLGNVAIARKMGFPEVILPGDVRNDLYLTLLCGEFPKGNKTSDKNVEVIVKVCNKKGETIPNVIFKGGGVPSSSEYHSVIYYHEDKPQWHETLKVAIPIEEFKQSHIKFFFKHRSSNEVKDKSEKYFAMSFVKLLQMDGTTLKDSNHNLLVYKMDHKKFDDNSIDYLDLASTQEETAMCPKQVNGLMLSTKDSFTISSNICSTKLTQNVNLLGLLNWAAQKESLNDSLDKLKAVDGDEIVKFLQDILDTLFGVLMENAQTTTYDEKVFNCLLHVINIINTDWKYQHFVPVLDLYIKESFSATLAYKKLIKVLHDLIIDPQEDTQLVFRTMKSMQYIMRFVARSRLLYLELNKDGSFDEVQDQQEFNDSMQALLNSIVKLCKSSEQLLREQGACLKYLPNTIPDILLIFDKIELSRTLGILLEEMPMNRLTKQKIMTMNEIVHSKLFCYKECRKILLPIFTKQIKTLFEQNEEGVVSGMPTNRRINKHNVAKVARVLGETKQCINQHTGYSEEVNYNFISEMELCIKIMDDILDLLFRDRRQSYDENNMLGYQTDESIGEIIRTNLRTISQSYIKMDKENPFAKNLVAIMIDIFRQMQDNHYSNYINAFGTSTDILDFLMEILMIFKELVNLSIFPQDWCEMIMLQNSVILKALRYFSYTIRDKFFEKFEQQAWSNFFHCAIAFMTQPSLQLESFTCDKRSRIIKRYKDMRREMGFEIRSMWFNLGQYKRKFVPGLVENILEMTLLPEVELRKASIPIFFDMMQCEYYSSSVEFESFGDTIRNSKNVKGNFDEFENEIIAKLDALFEGGRGDENYKLLFQEIMYDHCSQHASLNERGVIFVTVVTSLMERLLQYRNIIDDENKENRMICIVNLLDFYSEINRKEMYIRYVHKLYDLHLQCDNFTEAAYTLELHSNLLNWSNEILPPLLKSSKHRDAQTHRQLKELLYYKIIDNYNKGKMWECALEKCKELGNQYEEETFDYDRLHELHNRMALYYDNIMKQVRPKPEYFRVAYYGYGFPKFLQNKVFVYRGKSYERLGDFSSRIMNEFPKAELLTKLTPPSDDIKNSKDQYLQINSVKPMMELNDRFQGKVVSDQIIQFYQVNHVDKFQYSRRFKRKDPLIENDNEFATMWLERTVLVTEHSLPHILSWFPVKSLETYEISPLTNAIETMEKANQDLRALFVQYNCEKQAQVNPLSLKLKGILDPAVMGGIKNYENTFFTEEYENVHPEDSEQLEKLKDLIADQVPILELCVEVHKFHAPKMLHPLQGLLETRMAVMREEIRQKYGARTCNDLKLEISPESFRRHPSDIDDIRSSEIPIDSNNVTRSRVSSLTRSQVTSFKNLTLNLTSPSQYNASKLSSPGTKSLLLSPSRSLSHSPTIKKSKSQKDKRRSSKTDSITSTGNAQWYMASPEADNTVTNNISNGGTPVIELRQELTSKRPLRSEVEKEKRLSRPSSGQYSSRPSSLSLTMRAASSSGTSSNRDSIDSSVSEEDLPPPLPMKLRESESNFNNINVLSSNVTQTINELNSVMYAKNLLHIAEKENGAKPPTPPPKPPKKKKA
ncbi:PREDICTED: dedicator of cytokinesis protein 1 isoform X3 [Nicrophorus vespilloides]|uniref:Dedicator of cytokinesis protein 1 isoform X3 n=1 Tax=Nicrophorus vespilloides TaxID=110193 RepID=A0ABM1N684_NICVS|nr:PREDICTED: dedicator of cytokinesis protein 1 isoform X3 [Nicrophorus vespilloides]